MLVTVKTAAGGPIAINPDHVRTVVERTGVPGVLVITYGNGDTIIMKGELASFVTLLNNGFSLG